MNSMSWRHHFIPKFYLKGFADELGLINVYNVEKDIILPNPKSPKSFFFEEDRNTVTNADGELDDFIETKLYNSHDNLVKQAFEDLRKNGLKNVTDNLKALTLFIHFINTLFYRIPKFDIYHNSKILSGDSSYWLKVYDSEGNDKSYEFFEKRKTDKIYQYACRFSMGLKNILPGPDEAKKWSVYKLHDDWSNQLHLLTSDSPIIINNLDLFGTCQEVIIFPLTYKYFIIRSNTPLSEDLSDLEIVHLINLLIVKDAIKHVCSPTKLVLEKYRQESKKYSSDYLKAHIFNLIK